MSNHKPPSKLKQWLINRRLRSQDIGKGKDRNRKWTFNKTPPGF